MDLSKLAEPFPYEDIEWRPSRCGRNKRGVYCKVLAYITARAIQARLDEVCKPENWKIERPMVIDANGRAGFAFGLSIRIDDEWICRWDVCEFTKVSNIDSLKGGFSGAEKRAGAQWGIGRYLYYLDDAFADVLEERPSVNGKPDWTWTAAEIPERHGGGELYWKPPGLPGWALPREWELPKSHLIDLIARWRAKFAPDVESEAERREGFTRFVHSLCGDFPVADRRCWTEDAWNKVSERIDSTTDPNGPSPDVPFDD